MALRAIVTAPPYAGHLAEVASHPAVEGLRLNTVMPRRGTPLDVLQRFAPLARPLWVDLKGRQLRVVGAAIPPYTEVCLSHAVEVPTPTDAYFADGRERVRVAAVDGHRLILEDGPRRLVGPGESVNIPHPELRILGTLTDTDVAYLAAMKKLGLTQVMLSYVEQEGDVAEVREHLPEAEVMLKIESVRGLDLARRCGASLGRLLAARGDLYVELARPHQILRAVREVVEADPQAVVASRLFDSLERHPVPDCADIGDVGFLAAIGFRRFLLGDAVCLARDTVIEALNLLAAIGEDLDRA